MNLCSKSHKSLIKKLSRPELNWKKLFVLYIASILPNIKKVEIPCLHNKVALLMRKCSKWGTRYRHQRILKFLDHGIYGYRKC